MRIVVVFLLTICIIYLTIGLTLQLNIKTLVEQISAMNFIRIAWLSEDIIAVICLFYWQYSGQFELFAFMIEKCHEVRGLRSTKGKKIILQVKVFFGVQLLFYVGYGKHC